MRSPALLAVDQGPDAFAALFEAAREAGERVGWLDLSEEVASPLPSELASAAELGAMRAVHAGGGRTVVVKPVAGAAVLRDLVREHFLGCTLLLVRGLAGWPRLEPDGASFLLRSTSDRHRRLGAAELVAEIRRPLHRAGERRP